MTRLSGAAVAGVATAGAVTLFLAFGFRGHGAAISSPLVGRPAPAFSLHTIEGRRTISLASLRGRPVVLNFWQSSCVPCRQEQPLLVDAYRAYGGRVAFVGVSYEDALSAARAFARTHGGVWPTLRDPDGQLAIAYGVYGIPETFFIDRAGVIRAKVIGPMGKGTLERHILQLLGMTA
jgi:cytochrome c biogenesis protein CcmG/thiol:disulfide interchange protein DsbE